MAFYSTAQTQETKYANLEITGETVETVRGGETFFYKFTITNNSPTTAKNVISYQELDSSEGTRRKFYLVSVSANQGECETNRVSKYKPLIFVRCRFGDIQGYATVNYTTEVKLAEWGDISQPISEKTSNSYSKSVILTKTSKEESLEIERKEKNDVSKILQIHYPDTTSENDEQKKEQFIKKLSIKTFPSKNIPPRIEQVSPKQNAVIIKPLNKQIEVLVSVKAFDIDGKIEKVRVSDQSNLDFSFVFEGNQMKILFDGKTYTKDEWEILSEDEDFMKSREVIALNVGKDTFTYNAKKLNCGENRVLLMAIDNKGRSASLTVKFNVSCE
jgi:hypothetical protein